MSEDTFKCLICNLPGFEKSEISILTCKHVYCWSCIGIYITNNMNSSIKCPTSNCNHFINDVIIRKAIPDNKITEFENFGLSKLINDDDYCFKCLLPDCGLIVFYDKKAAQFECTNCSLFNCTGCKGTHPLLSCNGYQEAKRKALLNEEDRLSLKSMEDAEFAKARLVLKGHRLKKWLYDIELLDSFNNVPNDEMFSCSICMKVVSKGDGIKLRKCYHTFCKSCLHDGIVNSANVPIGCLEVGCKTDMEEREIRGILNDREYEIFQDKTLMVAQSMLQDIFHCKKPDCKFFGFLDFPEITNVTCPTCSSVNCVQCNAIHQPGMNCEEYQISKNLATNIDKKSLIYIEAEIKKGECMKCPQCGCIIRKAGGCNWIRCPQCKLELCWILKIARWGPKGSGDTSGGCRCGVNNILCDPTCKYGCIPEH